MVVVVLAIATVAGCSGSPRQPAPSSPAGPLDGAPGATGPAASPVAFPPLVLRADLGEAAARWERVAFLPFGDRTEQLSIKTFREGPSSLPAAFAVDADRSFWIDDRWKRRVVHYSASGDYLGEAGPLQSAGWDLAVQGGVVFVLVAQEAGSIGAVRDGAVLHTRVTYRGDSLFTFQIIPTVLGLVAEAGEVRGRRPGDLGSFVLLDLPRPEAKGVLPGLPLGKGDVYFDASLSSEPVHADGDQDFDLFFTSNEVAQTQPLQVDLIVHAGGTERSIPAEVGLTEPLPVGDDVLFLVKVAPTRPDDAERFGGGRWLLRVGASPLLWERLPYPETSDELQHRHLALGADGTIYLMVAEKGGELILRRPASGT